MGASNRRIAWLTPILGVDGNLLYFEPILKSFSDKYAAFCIFTAEYKKGDKDNTLCIQQCGRFKRLYKNVRDAKKHSEKRISGVGIVTPTIIRCLFRWKPDIMIINEFSLFSFYGVLASKFIKNTQVLFIVEARPRFNSSPFLSYLRTRFRRLLIKRADAILTNNDDGKRYLVDELGADETKIIAKPYLVSDISRFGTRPEQITYSDKNRDGCVHFLSVGWLVQPKGIHYALQAFGKLPQSLREKFVYNIVGDGPYRESLEVLAKELGIADQVTFHGKQPYESIGSFYQSSDVFLFPTLNDYRALSPFEALSYGMPVLGSIYNGGVNESTIEGKNGYSFDPKNTDYLAEIISRMISNTDIIDKFSLVSIEASKLYTLENAVNTLHDACSMLINNKS